MRLFAKEVLPVLKTWGPSVVSPEPLASATASA
jgi:hypothetical protein